MDFVIRKHMLLKEERKGLIWPVRVQRSYYALRRCSRLCWGELEKKVYYQSARCPSMNFESNVCSYDLTSHVNLCSHSETDCGPDLNMSAPFIPAATALPFTSCHKGQRALTFGVLPSHWIIHDIDLFFPLFFPPLSFLFIYWSAHMVVLWGGAFIHLAHL